MESKKVNCWRCGKSIGVIIGGVIFADMSSNNPPDAKHMTITDRVGDKVVNVNLCGRCADDVKDFLRFGPRTIFQGKEWK